MAGLLIYTLKTNQNEARWLQDTLDRYNRACDYIADYAFLHGEFISNNLDKALSKELQGDRFRLSSGTAKMAIKQVSKEFYSIHPKERGREQLPPHLDNKFVIYNRDTASLVMPTLPVNHTGEFPIYLSLSITRDKKGKNRREQWRFDIDDYVPEVKDENVATMRLTFNEELGKWQFLVLIKALSENPRPEFLSKARPERSYFDCLDDDMAAVPEEDDGFIPPYELDDGVPSDLD